MGGCFSLEDPINPLKVDITHFQSIKAIGEGGFGKVYAVQSRTNANNLFAMKMMRKSKLVRSLKHFKTVRIERDVMAYAESPFLVNIYHCFQSHTHVYFIMPFMRGGDLYWYIQTHGKMKEDMAKFYASETVLALYELWKRKIVYRDLKPDNLLLDDKGHCRLSDFGLCYFLREEDDFKVSGRWGTPGYMAPEVLKKGKKYDHSCDIWSFGITLYEFLHGHKPFSSDKLVSRSLVDNLPNLIANELSKDCKDLLIKLLKFSPKHRIGCNEEGWDEIMDHPWFSSIDWDKLENLEIPPPFLPNLDVVNCSIEYEFNEQFGLERPPSRGDRNPSSEEQVLFSSLDFNTDLSDTTRKKSTRSVLNRFEKDVIQDESSSPNNKQDNQVDEKRRFSHQDKEPINLPPDARNPSMDAGKMFKIIEESRDYSDTEEIKEEEEE